MHRPPELTLTPAERRYGPALVREPTQRPGYHQALMWIRRAPLIPCRNKWKSCSIDHVRSLMLATTGIQVTQNEMMLALAELGFSARMIEGELSTNPKLRYLPKPGDRVSMTLD